MKPQTKQMALKASLLVILAANVSWTLPKTFNSSDFASETGTTGGAATAAAAAVAATPTSGSDFSAVSLDLPTRTLKFTTCGEKFSVTFKEVKIKGVPSIQGSLKDVGSADSTTESAGTITLEVAKKGTFANTVDDAATRRIIVAKLTERLHEKPVCSSDIVTTSPTSPTAPSVAIQEKTDADKEAARIARGVKECTLDKRGKALTSDSRFDCNVARLNQTTMDQDDQDSDSGKPRHHRSGAMRQVESIARPMTQSIKADMLSLDKDKAELAHLKVKKNKTARDEDRLDKLADRIDEKQDRVDTRTEQLTDALTSLGENAEGTEADRLDHMVTNIGSFVDGAKVDYEAITYRAQLDDLNAQIAAQKTAMSNAPWQMQGAYSASLLRLASQKEALEHQVPASADYTNLQRLNTTGALDNSDYSDFTANYNRLVDEIRGVSASTATNYTAPANLVQMRQDANTRAGGLAIPSTMPNIDYRLLNLQPSTASTVPNNQMQTRNPVFYQPNAQQPFVRN